MRRWSTWRRTSPRPRSAAVSRIRSRTSTGRSAASTVSRLPRAAVVTPAARRAAVIRAWPSSPSTSTSSTPVASRNSSVREARSSRPPSSTTTLSLTRSSSPSRCEVTTTAMPKSWPIRRTSPSISSRAAGSSPLVGSSSRTSLGVVGEGLGELGLLLHAGGVATHRPVALLGEADVPQHLGGALAGGHPGQSGHHRHVHDEVAGADVRRQAVVLGQVAHRGPDGLALGGDVVPEHLRPAARRRDQAEQDLQKRRLARAVGADQAGGARRRCRGSAHPGPAPDRSPS